MKNDNILYDLSGKNETEKRCGERRKAVLNLFLRNNPAFEVCLRSLQDRDLPDNDLIALNLN